MPASIEVLIIGAGPSGLFAAVELARQGVRACVVERAPGPHTQARATAIQPGTLEIFAQAGVVDRVLAESVFSPSPTDCMSWPTGASSRPGPASFPPRRQRRR